MEKLTEYIKERIKHLKKCEMDYFNSSCDDSKPQFQRDLDRRYSNEFNARRSELEILQKEIKP